MNQLKTSLHIKTIVASLYASNNMKMCMRIIIVELLTLLLWTLMLSRIKCHLQKQICPNAVRYRNVAKLATFINNKLKYFKTSQVTGYETNLATILFVTKVERSLEMTQTTISRPSDSFFDIYLYLIS